MMRLRPRLRRGVTVVELLIAAVIGAVLSLAITKVFFSSVRVSRKGMEHLTNVQNASIMMNQLDQDFRRAGSVQPPPADIAGGLLQITGEDEQGLLTVVYARPADGLGILRRVTRVSSDPAIGEHPHLYCQGLPTTVEFAPVSIGDRLGYSVFLKISSAGPGGEEISLKRLFYLPNLPENRRLVTFDWTFGN